MNLFHYRLTLAVALSICACGEEYTLPMVDWQTVGALNAIAGSRDSNHQSKELVWQYYIAGESGKLIHFDGDHFGLIQTPSNAALRGIARGASTWVAVGCADNGARDEGEIIYGSADSWTFALQAPAADASTSLHTPCFNAVTAHPHGFIAVGANGLIETISISGTNWAIERGDITQNTLRGVHAHDERLAMAVGEGGTILRRDNQIWSKMESPVVSNLNAILILEPLNAIAVGDDGVILRFDGAKWAIEPSGTNATLTSISATIRRPPNDRTAKTLLVSARDGTIRSKNASSAWGPIPTDTSEELLSLWSDAVNQDDAKTLAVGAHGTILELSHNDLR